MTYTQGPWSIRTSKNLTAIVTPKGEMQLSLHGVYDGLKPLSVDLNEWKANAQLISTAPELLEALQDALNTEYDRDEESRNFDEERLHEWASIIKKAKGEGL